MLCNAVTPRAMTSRGFSTGSSRVSQNRHASISPPFRRWCGRHLRRGELEVLHPIGDADGFPVDADFL
jgi:hypothetical protein